MLYASSDNKTKSKIFENFDYPEHLFESWELRVGTSWYKKMIFITCCAQRITKVGGRVFEIVKADTKKIFHRNYC